MDEPTPQALSELQNPDNWDWEHAAHGAPNPQAGISYRVRFHGEEVHAIGEAARAQGISDLEFIRQAALAAARESRQPAR